MNLVMENIKEIIKEIRDEVYNLFLDDDGEKRTLYIRRDWIFPNHFDIMIMLAKDMCQKYKGDIDVCEVGILLHDTGLVYRRETASPAGHEDRSVEYAKEIMSKHRLDDEFKNKVIKCIEATDATEEPISVDAKIVRAADALSQFISVHFFAKAAFSGDWDFYSGWLKKKVTNNFKKICFEDEIKRAKPIREYILAAIDLHESNKLS